MTVIVIKNFLNPKRHQNPVSGSKVTAILLKGWILPIGGLASRRVCACSLRSRLVFTWLPELLHWWGDGDMLLTTLSKLCLDVCKNIKKEIISLLFQWTLLTTGEEACTENWPGYWRCKKWFEFGYWRCKNGLNYSKLCGWQIYKWW